MNQHYIILLMLILGVASIIPVTGEDTPDWVTKVQELDQQGRYDETLAVVEQVIELNPDDLDALVTKLCILGKLQRYEEQYAFADEILAKFPECIPAWSVKSSYFHSLGRFEESSQTAMRAKELLDAEAAKGGTT